MWKWRYQVRQSAGFKAADRICWTVPCRKTISCRYECFPAPFWVAWESYIICIFNVGGFSCECSANPPQIKKKKAKTNRVLLRKWTGHNKHPLPTTQEKTLYMDITRWSTLKSDWLYSLQPKMDTVSKNKTRSWLWLRPWTPYCQIQTEIEESRENH